MMNILNNLLLFLASFALGELFALLIFYFVRKRFESGGNSKKAVISVLKGCLERFVLLLGLASSIPTIIIFFGAIKLGTRLKDQLDSKISNDYFLIGNILSVAIAIIAFLIYQELTQ